MLTRTEISPGLEALHGQHGRVGQRLFNSTEGQLFPCDLLALTVLERSLNQLKSFSTLMQSGGYVTAAAVLRMQLDNFLRFHGVASSGDPHGLANDVANGVPIRKLKDSSGNKLTDQWLVQLHDLSNPDVRLIYELASGYVHLSFEHIRHFLARSSVGPAGERIFSIGDEDDYVSAAAKDQLLNAFSIATKAILSSVDFWTDARTSHGTIASLSERFTTSI